MKDLRFKRLTVHFPASAMRPERTRVPSAAGSQVGLTINEIGLERSMAAIDGPHVGLNELRAQAIESMMDASMTAEREVA